MPRTHLWAQIVSVSCTALVLRAAGLTAADGRTDVPAAELITPSVCYVGARCILHVRATCSANATCALEPTGRVGTFEVLEIGAPVPVRGALDWPITVIGFEPARVEIDPLVVSVSTSDGTVHRVTTPRQELQLSMEESSGAALTDVTQPFNGGRDLRPFVNGALAVLALVLLVVIAWRIVRGRRRRSPDVGSWDESQAAKRLGRLEHAQPTTDSEILRWYSDLLDIVKGHGEWALSMPAMPLTSSELASVVETAGGDGGLVADIRELLVAIDAVKYGAERPSHPQRRVAWQCTQSVTRALTALRGARLKGEHHHAR